MTVLKLTERQLRKIISEVIAEVSMKKYDFGGSQPEESYEDELLQDPSYLEPSVYVPDDIKKKISSWATDMGLVNPKRGKNAIQNKKTKVQKV